MISKTFVFIVLTASITKVGADTNNVNVTVPVRANSTFKCTGKRDGNYYHPYNCTKFLTCTQGKVIEKDCPICENEDKKCPEGRKHYDEPKDSCVFPNESQCKIHESWDIPDDYKRRFGNSMSSSMNNRLVNSFGSGISYLNRRKLEDGTIILGDHLLNTFGSRSSYPQTKRTHMEDAYVVQHLQGAYGNQISYLSGNKKRFGGAGISANVNLERSFGDGIGYIGKSGNKRRSGTSPLVNSIIAPVNKASFPNTSGKIVGSLNPSTEKPKKNLWGLTTTKKPARVHESKITDFRNLGGKRRFGGAAASANVNLDQSFGKGIGYLGKVGNKRRVVAAGSVKLEQAHGKGISYLGNPGKKRRFGLGTSPQDANGDINGDRVIDHSDQGSIGNDGGTRRPGNTFRNGVTITGNPINHLWDASASTAKPGIAGNGNGTILNGKPKMKLWGLTTSTRKPARVFEDSRFRQRDK